MGVDANASHKGVSTGTDRLPGLDGLRGIAVLLDLLLHYCPHTATRTVLDRIIRRGGFGVEVFFVLSGFLITDLLLREERAHGHISIRLFYARRALRILPPLLLLLIFLAVARGWGGIQTPVRDLFAGLFFFRNYAGTSGEQPTSGRCRLRSSSTCSGHLR